MLFIEKKTRSEKIFRVLLTLFVLFCFVQTAHSQVTIGSQIAPNADAILELIQNGETKGGLLLPRVALQQTTSCLPMGAHTKGMVVYNTATVADVVPGLYYNNGTKWMKQFSAEDSFFYMPSTVLPTDQSDPRYIGGVFTVNLYNTYKEQFGLSATNVVKSDNTAKLPVYNSTELHYFVTYYDDTVFTNVAISPAGVLTYKLRSGFTYSEKTYMNIVLKVK